MAPVSQPQAVGQLDEGLVVALRQFPVYANYRLSLPGGPGRDKYVHLSPADLAGYGFFDAFLSRLQCPGQAHGAIQIPVVHTLCSTVTSMPSTVPEALP